MYVLTLLSTSPQTQSAAISNDTIIGDPLFKAAVWLQDEERSTNLCYEIHGRSNMMFSLVSDVCVAVNARYVPMNNPDEGNIINDIGVVAVGSGNTCYHIRVQLNNGSCQASSMASDGSGSRTFGSSFDETFNDINIRQRMSSRVRISVPNCENLPLVMWVTCETVRGQGMIRFDITRGLNLRPTSHGLLGMLYIAPFSYDYL